MSDDGPGDAGRQWVADLYRNHGAALLQYLTARVGAAAAEDLTAETFIVAIRRRDMFDDARGTGRAWLFGIASNAVREHFRREVRYLRVVVRAGAQRADDQSHADAVDDRLDAEAAVARLVPRLLSLSPVDRDVLLLTSWAGLGPSEVAEALGLTAATVRSRLHRIRRKLRAPTPPEGVDQLSESAVTASPAAQVGLKGIRHA
ncbi:RNA polymerase sigma-70 factor (ECF subfamily) [Nakamurella sp. UYEF19]|uniref:RNA polymerase sigma factor n=1 Tax=Nakamurella sp. UYEF19 TaxID=1756392 RepID=UPI003397333D